MIVNQIHWVLNHAGLTLEIIPNKTRNHKNSHANPMPKKTPKIMAKAAVIFVFPLRRHTVPVKIPEISASIKVKKDINNGVLQVIFPIDFYYDEVASPFSRNHVTTLAQMIFFYENNITSDRIYLGKNPI